MEIGVHKLAMAAPNDVSGLERLIADGTIDPAAVVALIGKTEGNGGANDFTRGYATLSYQLLLARHLGCTPEEVGRRIAFVWSGGCEGVLSPHATLFTRVPGAARTPGTPSRGDGTASPGGGKRLALGIAETRAFAPEEIGTMAVVEAVAEAVRRARAEAGIADPADVHYVQVKGPLLTPAGMADADRRGAALVTRDPNGSKAYARGSTALGVAVGLGEVPASAVTQDTIARSMDLFSAVASTSAGGELKACEVLLFGNAEGASGPFRIGHAVLGDVIDADGVEAALRDAGLRFHGSPGPAERERIAAVFAKAEASPTGAVRGRRNTMLSDADINYERHARAALGAVIASITGDPAIFVSGGTEHQCAPGAAPIAAIVRADP